MYHWIDILRFCETCHCNIFEACFRMNYIKTNAFNDCHIHLRHYELCIIIILLQHYMFKCKRSFWTTPVDQKSALYNLILTIIPCSFRVNVNWESSYSPFYEIFVSSCLEFPSRVLTDNISFLLRGEIL